MAYSLLIAYASTPYANVKLDENEIEYRAAAARKIAIEERLAQLQQPEISGSRSSSQTEHVEKKSPSGGAELAAESAAEPEASVRSRKLARAPAAAAACAPSIETVVQGAAGASRRVTAL